MTWSRSRPLSIITAINLRGTQHALRVHISVSQKRYLYGGTGNERL